MSMIKDIKTYLISQGVSTPIFLGHVPEETQECIGLYRYAGKPPLKEADIDRCGLQIRCRAESYEEAYDTARLVCMLLSSVGDEDIDGDAVVIDGTKYYRVHSMQSMQINENDLYTETMQNFAVYMVSGTK